MIEQVYEDTRKVYGKMNTAQAYYRGYASYEEYVDYLKQLYNDGKIDYQDLKCLYRHGDIIGRSLDYILGE